MKRAPHIAWRGADRLASPRRLHYARGSVLVDRVRSIPDWSASGADWMVALAPPNGIDF